MFRVRLRACVPTICVHGQTHMCEGEHRLGHTPACVWRLEDNFGFKVSPFTWFETASLLFVVLQHCVCWGGLTMDFQGFSCFPQLPFSPLKLWDYRHVLCAQLTWVLEIRTQVFQTP